MKRSVLVLSVALAVCSAALGQQPAPAGPGEAGPLSPVTMQRLLLTDAARVGNRVVAVGDARMLEPVLKLLAG